MTFVRYIGVQVIAYGIDLGTFLSMVHAGVAVPVTANVLGKILAGTFAYFAHRAFTFRRASGSAGLGSAARYFALLAINSPLSSLVLATMLKYLDSVQIGKVLSDVVMVGVTYFLSKHFVFGRLR